MLRQRCEKSIKALAREVQAGAGDTETLRCSRVDPPAPVLPRGAAPLSSVDGREYERIITGLAAGKVPLEEVLREWSEQRDRSTATRLGVPISPSQTARSTRNTLRPTLTARQRERLAGNGDLSADN